MSKKSLSDISLSTAPNVARDSVIVIPSVTVTFSSARTSPIRRPIATHSSLLLAKSSLLRARCARLSSETMHWGLGRSVDHFRLVLLLLQPNLIRNGPDSPQRDTHLHFPRDLPHIAHGPINSPILLYRCLIFLRRLAAMFLDPCRDDFPSYPLCAGHAECRVTHEWSARSRWTTVEHPFHLVRTRFTPRSLCAIVFGDDALGAWPFR